MKVTFKGVADELPNKLQEKLDSKFAKLSKLLEKRGEKEAHVIVTKQRKRYKAEITLQFYDHQLVGASSDADLFTAMSDALAKLEKQAVKQRAKWREKSRRPAARGTAESPADQATSREAAAAPRIYRVNHYERRKPITLDEALLQMEGRQGYLVYRDADRDHLSVLIRRTDGNFDLIEA